MSNRNLGRRGRAAGVALLIGIFVVAGLAQAAPRAVLGELFSTDN